MLGPVVKIHEADLPHRKNLHFLGQKSYKQLPAYMSNWDLAMLPFARNESTRFISPTKTPEYLAAGRPVISTPITDVVRPYGEMGLVTIAEKPEQWVNAGEHLIANCDRIAMQQHLRRVDAFLAGNSWDRTWKEMQNQILKAASRDHSPPSAAPSVWPARTSLAECD